MTKQSEQPTSRSTSVRLWPSNVDRINVLMAAWKVKQSEAINVAVFACWLLLEFGSRKSKESIHTALSHARRTFDLKSEGKSLDEG